MRFQDKNVLVIGGNSGIGLATAKAFHREGARVFITGRDPDSLLSVQRELGVHLITCRSDIADVRQINALFNHVREEFDHLDVLFVNSGIGILLPIESVSEVDWDMSQDINVKGTFFSVQAALPLMSRGSAIILMGSIAALLGEPGGALYAASKAAVRSLGRSLAAELVNRGIRVNVVSPGPIDTPMLHRIVGVPAQTVPFVRQEMLGIVPMKRLGTPEEVAAAVLFLASDESSFVTGIELIVDGGSASFW